mgnify:FL=1
MAQYAKGKTLKRLGKNALKQKDPASAITLFEAYLKTNKKDAEAIALLGRSHMEMRDYEKAKNIFLRAYNTNKAKAPEALYFYAQMLKSNGRYDSARTNFEKFKKEYKGSQRQLKKQAGKEIAFCDSLQKLLHKENKIKIVHLDTSINKVNTEASPFNLDENTLLFTSYRTEKKEYVSEDDTAKPKTKKLYYAKRKKDKWVFEGEFGNDFNKEDFNTGNACFSADHKRLYFARCKENIKGEMICAIYVSKKEGDNWLEPEKLPKPVNSKRYSSTMPAIATDPVKGNDIIYYVTNKKSGKGGTDIWYTVYDKKHKEYKVPKNAGTKINTAENEMSPFFDNETRTLYYSSDGMGGFGGYDVFKATGDGKKWNVVENMGQPINSGADDIYYSISSKRSEGFLVSNRKGGNSLKNKTCCDDIYFYQKPDYAQIILKGNISDMLDKSASVSKAKIEIFIKDKSGEKFLIKTINSDSLGNYRTEVDAGHDYIMVVKKDNFLGTSEDINAKDVTRTKTIDRDLHLIKKPKGVIRIPNIQYEFDKSNILESSKLSLDTTVLVMMQLNPEIVVEIQSHTDSKGNESYNLKLSQKRAESVVNYLVGKGIDKKRLLAKGYGESQPIAPNENKDGSDNPEGRAKNRRTDFRIIGVVDGYNNEGSTEE